MFSLRFFSDWQQHKYKTFRPDDQVMHLVHLVGEDLTCLPSSRCTLEAETWMPGVLEIVLECAREICVKGLLECNIFFSWNDWAEVIALRTEGINPFLFLRCKSTTWATADPRPVQKHECSCGHPEYPGSDATTLNRHFPNLPLLYNFPSVTPSGHPADGGLSFFFTTPSLKPLLLRLPYSSANCGR